MDKRQTLQSELEAILGSRNVYYQPPANLKIQYPAIRYKKQKIISKKADNKKYLKKTLYEVIVIDQMPDNPAIDKILEIPYSEYDRWYSSDGLNHDVISLYY